VLSVWFALHVRRAPDGCCGYSSPHPNFGCTCSSTIESARATARKLWSRGVACQRRFPSVLSQLCPDPSKGPKWPVLRETSISHMRVLDNAQTNTTHPCTTNNTPSLHRNRLTPAQSNLPPSRITVPCACCVAAHAHALQLPAASEIIPMLTMLP
jgi:hypothetical protein